MKLTQNSRPGLLLLFLCLCWTLSDLSRWQTLGAEGVIYYNRITTLNEAVALHRVNADGTGDQRVPINLPSPAYPTVSRDGQQLLVTSPDPGRPFKISNNVYLADLAAGTLGRVTSFEDVVQLQGIILTNDLGNTSGHRNISGYVIHSPFHKAFSPDGSRVVVLDLRKVGVVNRDTPLDPQRSTELTAGSGRAPAIEIYRTAGGAPDGPYVYLGVDRSIYNQAGDGIDWHPNRAEVIASVRSDIPATGTAGVTSMEGTLIYVFTARAPGDVLRKLTTASGRWDTYVDAVNIRSISHTEHDYSPAISPDGRQVAYARNTLRVHGHNSLAPLPAICSIRVINYDGTGDREVLRMAEGLWVSKLAWSPDGSEIAFDLAPQVILQGWNIQLGDSTRSEIHVVGQDGSNPRRIVAAPAAFPTWAPGSAQFLPTEAPLLQARRNGDSLEIIVDRLVPGREFEIEQTTDLQNWTRLLSERADSRTESLTITAPPGRSSTFYRIRLL